LAPKSAKAEDKLFATLDPTSRQVKLGDGQVAIVTDTVGFIHKLPHQLVDAFRATLEEVTRADVLIEVVDASDRHFAEHRATVQTVLDELGAGEKPRVVTFNKADLLDTPAGAVAAGVGIAVGAAGMAVATGATGRAGGAGAPVAPPVVRPIVAPIVAGSVLVSAKTGFGLDALREELAALVGPRSGRTSTWPCRTPRVSSSPGVRERGTVAPRLPRERRTGLGSREPRSRWRAARNRRAMDGLARGGFLGGMSDAGWLWPAGCGSCGAAGTPSMGCTSPPRTTSQKRTASRTASAAKTAASTAVSRRSHVEGAGIRIARVRSVRPPRAW